MPKPFSSLALALLLLAGCAVGPAYQPPVAEVPAAYRAGTETGGTWPAAEWWRGFASAELDTLIADARTNSPDIQAALARIRQADAQLRMAGASFWPTVGLSANAQWARSPQSRRSGTQLVPTGRYSESRSYGIGPSIAWEADLWGRLAAGRDAAASAALATRFDERNIALNVITAIANT